MCYSGIIKLIFASSSYERSFLIMDTKLDLLKQIANGMTKQFGPDCEIVIHDLTQNNLDNSIVYIENGHVSGRRVGGTILCAAS